jgi:hypothetical protein
LAYSIQFFILILLGVDQVQEVFKYQTNSTCNEEISELFTLGAVQGIKFEYQFTS